MGRWWRVCRTKSMRMWLSSRSKRGWWMLLPPCRWCKGRIYGLGRNDGLDFVLRRTTNLLDQGTKTTITSLNLFFFPPPNQKNFPIYNRALSRRLFAKKLEFHHTLLKNEY